MQDILIFPTFMEQVGTKAIFHETYTLINWRDVSDEAEAFVSSFELDIAPMDFFEWAYRIPSGRGSVLNYCLNLSTQFLVDPSNWMMDVVHRLRIEPRRLTDGN